jgi:hypothetical protein
MVADVFSHQEDARVKEHLLAECFIESLGIRHGWHKAY